MRKLLQNKNLCSYRYSKLFKFPFSVFLSTVMINVDKKQTPVCNEYIFQMFVFAGCKQLLFKKNMATCFYLVRPICCLTLKQTYKQELITNDQLWVKYSFVRLINFSLKRANSTSDNMHITINMPITILFHFVLVIQYISIYEVCVIISFFI